MDLRGAFVPTAAPPPDIGGYWLCLRFREAREPIGGSIFADVADVVEELMLCRVEVLCRRSNDPALVGRGPDTARVPAAPRDSFEASIASAGHFAPTIVVFLSAGGSRVKFFEAALMLLCRSSKLGDGRNS